MKASYVLGLIEKLEGRIKTLEEIVDSDREDFLNFVNGEETSPAYEEVDEVSSVLAEEEQSDDERYIEHLEWMNSILREQVEWYANKWKESLVKLERLK